MSEQHTQRAEFGSLSAGELSQVLTHFNEAAARLQQTHEQLRGEVARLQRELNAANEEIARSRHLAALGEMAAGIAHEVRNPLGSIRLLAKMIEDDLYDRPDQRALAGKILLAVRGLDAVVGDVLSFSRTMVASKSRCRTADVLEAAVSESIAALAGTNRAEARSIEVRYVPTGAAEEHLHCDAGLIHRALVNIIQNAIQAMCPDPADQRPNETRKSRASGERPVLVIGASSRRVMGPDGGMRSLTVLSVRDNGPGVPSEVMERMFNPFFTTRAAGTGLGLAIVHRIVDAHGGTVRVRNHESGGAIVELALPCGDEIADGSSVVVRPASRAPASAA
ncbi:MAG: nitrogen regulation protein NR(II) [Phycisphaerales bacterium]